MNLTLDEYIQANLSKPQSERETNVHIGRLYGVSEATVRRHADKLRVDDFFGIPMSVISSRSRTARLEDGSYEKITYDPKALTLLHSLSYEDVEKAVSNYKPKTKPRPRTGGTLVACAADFQAGKTDMRGGTIELVDRVNAVLSRWSEELDHYDTIILADCGDVIENFTNVVSQAQTNDLSLTDQIRVAQRLMLETLMRLSEKCDRLIYVAVPSNHSAVRTGVGSKNRSNAPDDDYGLLIQDNIELVLKDRPEYDHVEFVRPLKWEHSVTVVTDDGTGVAFTHGDMAKNQANLNRWFADMAHGHVGQMHLAHILVHGHFHTPAISMSGDCKWIVGAPSIDNGSAWFTNLKGASSPSAMLTFEARNGRVENWKMWEGVE